MRSTNQTVCLRQEMFEHSTNQTVCPRKEMLEYTTEINSSSILNVSHEIYCPCPHKAIKTLDLYSILSSVLFIFANVLYVLHRCAAFWYFLITHLVSSNYPFGTF